VIYKPSRQQQCIQDYLSIGHLKGFIVCVSLFKEVIYLLVPGKCPFQDCKQSYSIFRLEVVAQASEGSCLRSHGLLVTKLVLEIRIPLHLMLLLHDPVFVVFLILYYNSEYL
jgi:hypothetical protein